MADFTGIAVRARMEASSENEPGAKAGAHGAEHHVLTAPSGPVPPLGERARIGVVLQDDGNAKGPAEVPGDGNGIPPRQVGR